MLFMLILMHRGTKWHGWSIPLKNAHSNNNEKGVDGDNVDIDDVDDGDDNDV